VLVREESLNKKVVEELKNLGVGIEVGDLNKMKELKDVLSKFEAVVSVTIDPNQELELTKTIEETSVKLFIPSIWIPKWSKTNEKQNILVDAKRPIVEVLSKGKTPYIILYIGFFLDSPRFLGWNLDSGDIELYNGEKEVSVIHTDDVAKLIPYVLNDTSIINKDVYLETERITTNQVIQWAEDAGKKVNIIEKKEEDLDEIIKNSYDPFNFFALFNSQYKKSAFFSDENLFDAFNTKYEGLEYKKGKEYVKNVISGIEGQYRV
jgi:hypothetical protein